MTFFTGRDALLVAGVAYALMLSDPATPRADRAVGAVVPPPTATVHPPVAREAARLWMAPSASDRTAAAAIPSLVDLQAALRLYADEKYDQALARFSAASTPKSPLRAHAAYYAGVCELRLRRFEAARRRFTALKDTDAFVGEAAALGEAEAAQGMGDFDAAVRIYAALLEKDPGSDMPAIWLSLANAALADGDRKEAADAFLHLYYEFPVSEHAANAEAPLQSLSEVQQISTGNTRYKLEMGRGERMFGSKRYADARTSFLRVKPHASREDADLVGLRLAEIDYFEGRYTQSRGALQPYLNSGPRQAEARFFYLMTQRGLRNTGAFEQLARNLTQDFADTSWAEDALNHLATFYILQDRDEEGDSVLRDLYARFPRGRHGERAAWKTGWAAYRAGNMSDAVQRFESASTHFPRSDYRPAWLYWSARAREAMGDRPGAIERYRLTLADYHHTYYGRLATRVLQKHGVAPGPNNLIFAQDGAQPGGEQDDFPPTEEAIRTLLALGLYEPAVKELEFARRKWGDTPAITATIAWANKQMSLSESGSQQFALARGSITLIKRAYPQFMAGGGDQLPREILTTIFPLSYWDLIRKYSAQHNLDPYLIAALMAQESTFVPDIKSHAGAYGLMQLMPPTGRQYARKFKLRYSLRLLTTADTNVRIGTAYFADKIREFGGVHTALASYNAGETPVRRWIRENPNLPQEEFIDNIPYPETQHYVKRILGTAEDYRRLYGGN